MIVLILFFAQELMYSIWETAKCSFDQGRSSPVIINLPDSLLYAAPDSFRDMLERTQAGHADR